MRVEFDDPMPGDNDAPSNVTPITRARKAKKPKQQKGGDRTELDISEMFVRKHGANFRYCSALGGWFVWSGACWELDSKEQARESVKDVARYPFTPRFLRAESGSTDGSDRDLSLV